MKKKSTKEKIIEALEEKKTLRCPNCNHSVFIRKTYDKVQMIDDGEGITDEPIELCCEDCVYICAKCDEEISEEELK